MYKQGGTEILRFPISKLNGRLEDMIILFVSATLEDIIRTTLQETWNDLYPISTDSLCKICPILRHKPRHKGTMGDSVAGLKQKIQGMADDFTISQMETISH